MAAFGAVFPETMIYCTDLDGTLIPNDMSVTSFFSVNLKNPLMLIPSLWWLIRSGGRREVLKFYIARRYAFDPAKLSWNREVLDFLREQAANPENEVYIVSGSADALVKKIAFYHGFFRNGFGTNPEVNLVGKNKLAYLRRRFPDQEICYIGNSRTDLRVWEGVSSGMVVSDNQRLIEEAKSVTRIDRVFPPKWEKTGSRRAPA